MRLIFFAIVILSLVYLSCIHRPTINQMQDSCVVSVGRVSQAAGKTVAVPISISRIKSGILGIDLQVEYNPDVLSFVSLEPGPLAKDWQLSCKEDKGNGRLNIGMYSIHPLEEKSGVFLVLNLEVNKDVTVGSTSVLRLNRVILNEKPAAKLEDGLITVVKE